MQAHDAIGLWPAPVVADAHADLAAQGVVHRKAEVARLEIALLQMLERPPWLMLGMARQMDLAVLAGDPPAPVDQDRAVEMPAFRGELGVAQIEGDAEFGRCLEQRAGNRARHLGLEVRIDLGLRSRYQRGKKVVSASSGKTTSSAPRPVASRSNAKRRATACSRLSLRAMGPSCAAAMVSGRGTRRVIL